MRLVWKALADDSRRQILDLLRDGPMTTGALAEHFAWDRSRYGVMKHLKVLESAELVTTQKRGRERWNYLNALPLRRIYERWLGPYQEFWSTNLLRLKDFAETRQHKIETADNRQSREKNMEFNAFDIQQEFTLKASKDAVWNALTKNMSQWWAYRVGEQGSVIHFDPKLGGKFEERWGDGEGVTWGEVVEIRFGNKLRLKGSCGMTGAGVGDWCYEIEGKGDTTLLRLSHHGYGYRDPETGNNYTGGWQGLLDGHLRAWLESGTVCEAMYK